MNSIQIALLGALTCVGFADSAHSAAPAEILYQAVAPERDTQTIDIVSGTYGPNCGAPTGNATRELASRCNGRLTCEYELNGTVGDRDTSTCRRSFQAEWRCSTAEFHVAALSAGAEPGDTLVLSCARETGPGR